MENTARQKPHRALLTAILLFLAAATVVLSVNIRQITVTGNSRYTEDEIIRMLFRNKLDWNSAYLFWKENTKEHIQIPFVEEYKVDFLSPFDVEILIHEKTVVGYVAYMGSCMYFDKDGIIVESTDERLEGIPCVTGLRFGQIVLHQPLPVEDGGVFEDILNLTQLLSIRHLEVDRIQYNSKGEASLYFGNVEVILGDGSQMDGKISLLANIMPQIRDLDGTLYLDNYDETNTDMISTFKKNLKN